MDPKPTPSSISKKEAGVIFIIMAIVPMALGAYGALREDSSFLSFRRLFIGLFLLGIPFLIVGVAFLLSGRKRPKPPEPSRL